VGVQHAKGEPRIVVHQAGGGEPDHRVLMADYGQAVIDQGEILYGKNCASCHGVAGDSNPNNAKPAPRNFKTEGLKNSNGNGPWGFYSVLIDGYGAAMPAFRNLTPQERWAVTHFVRETMIKPHNPTYAAKDKPEIEAKIPAAGATGGKEVEVDPRTVALPTLLPHLMAGWSAQETPRVAAVAAWIDRADANADPVLAPSFAHLRQLVHDAPGDVERLADALVRNDREAAAKVLIAEDGAGSAKPAFTLLPASTFNALLDRLAATTPIPGAKP
jgi:mono/diheme cytochrome c family protein